MAAGDHVLLCDKPAGVTSHDVVADVRRRLGRRGKVGHAGTLDPFATGLLIVLVGRATRAQRFFMALPKRYEVVARFGAVSSTGDPEGEIEETGRVPDGPLALPTGVIRQRPPAYSAVKVGGRRAYALARAGEAVELAERSVTVYRFEQRWVEGDRRAFSIECSSGTYVRSLIAALGDAYCVSLRRTGIGGFEVADADPERPIALGEALHFLPEVRLDDAAAWRAAHGQAVPAPDGCAAIGVDETVRLTDGDGLVALAQLSASDRGDGGDGGHGGDGGDRGEGLLRPVVGFRGA